MGPTDELRERLGDPDEEVRHSAVLAVAAAGEEAVPLLAEALGDASWRVRKAALELLIQSPSPGVLPRLVAGLRDEDNAGRRNSCMEALIRLGPAAVPALAPLLEDADPDLRKFVVDAAGNIDDPAVPELLLRALADPEENVAAAAAEFLGRRRLRAAVPGLIGRIDDGVWLAFGCLRALGEIGDPEAAPAVIAKLRDPGLRRVALEALGKLGGEETVPILLEGLGSHDRALRRVAAAAARDVLARLGPSHPGTARFAGGVRQMADAEFMGFLRELLAGEDPALREAAAALLALAPGPEAVRMVLEAFPGAPEPEQELYARVLEGLPEQELHLLVPPLRYPNADLRRLAAEVIGRRRLRVAVPTLLALLEDRTGHVRAAAARALGSIGDVTAVAPLTTLLRDSYPDVREAALEAVVSLGEGDEERDGLVLSLLEPHLATDVEGDEEVAAAVIRIVGRLQGRRFAGRLGRALRDDRDKVRRAAAEALGQIGGPEAVEALRVALTDEDVAVRREAVQRLGQTGEATAIELLLPMLQDDDLWVRVRTVQALAAFDHPGVHRALLAAAANEPPGPKRLAAVRALGQGRVPGALAVLTALGEAPDRETRKAAVEALGVLGDRGAVETLLARLADEEWGLRVAAAKALAGFADDRRVREALARAASADADALVRSTAEGLLASLGEAGG